MKRSTRYARFAFAGLAWLFVACVAVQTFLAGSAVFSNADHWRLHAMFVHLFEIVPLLMLAAAFAGRYPAAAKLQSFALFALIIAQYATANIPGAGAVHPVIALVMFVLAVVTAREAGRDKAGRAAS